MYSKYRDLTLPALSLKGSFIYHSDKPFSLEVVNDISVLYKVNRDNGQNYNFKRSLQRSLSTFIYESAIISFSCKL